MKEEIFRKKSLDKIKSPEVLNDYIKISNPSLWLLLAAVIALFAGACIWGIFGHIDNIVKTEMTVSDGTAVCIVTDLDVKPDMTVKIEETESIITDVKYERKSGKVVGIVTAETDLPDGTYNAEIVTESVKPISFILN